MNTFEELYFTIKFRRKYAIEGLIRYKRIGNVEKDGDIIAEFIRLKFLDKDTIQVVEGKQIAHDVIIYGKNHCSYSVETKENTLIFLTFEELQRSEYWEDILQKYEFNEVAFKNYNKNYCNDDRDSMKLECYASNGNCLSVEFNKINNELCIWNNEQEFTGNIFELKVLSTEEYDELMSYKVIIDLIKNGHDVEMLKNGYVVDKEYYEDIQDYIDNEVKSNE